VNSVFAKGGLEMAEIRPFQGIRYNQRVIPDLTRVICPPYDIISPQQQDALYQCSEYNFVRIEYNREVPQDNSQENRYTRAAANIRQWLTQGVLQAESVPGLYLHVHRFTCGGETYQRQNILAAVRLEEWDRKIIRPHENIIPRAKSDRLSMLYSCQANTSPVLAMYEDPRKAVFSALAALRQGTPVMDFPDLWGDRHRVWVITQEEVVRQVRQSLAEQPLYIADGHHRYDSALTYQRERKAQSAAFTGEEGFNFLMMSLVDFADPGLVILPPHRLVKGISRPALAGLKSQLREFFDIEELSLGAGDVWQKVDARLTGMSPDMPQVRLAVFGLEAGSLLVLTLRDQTATNQLMPAFHGDLYKRLDVSLVDHIVLEKLLAFDKDKEEITLAYSYDRLDAVNRVKDQEYQLLFILNPVRPGLIKSIADAGDRMPRKSTYFYPKSPAGLVFYRW
jgi:uncharacterized protein (DUF1015 family)